MRFVYCAASICTILNNFETINKDKIVNYILNSLTYEGAFGQGPGLETHGGSTYCALAALSMLDRLQTLEDHVQDKCRKWLSFKLSQSFHGRPNKVDDTCYTWWVGSALKILDPHEKFVDDQIMHCLDFILSTQDGITGGLAKLPDCPPDPLHTYLGLSGLALVPFSELRPVDPELNITKRARDFLRTLHHKSDDCTKSTTNCLAL